MNSDLTWSWLTLQKKTNTTRTHVKMPQEFPGRGSHHGCTLWSANETSWGVGEFMNWFVTQAQWHQPIPDVFFAFFSNQKLPLKAVNFSGGMGGGEMLLFPLQMFPHSKFHPSTAHTHKLQEEIWRHPYLFLCRYKKEQRNALFSAISGLHGNKLSNP